MYYSYQRDDQNRSRDHVSWRYGLFILASSTDFSHLRSVACAQPAKSTPTRWLQHYASCREHGPLERKHTNPTEHPHYNPIENTHHTPSNPQSQPINGTGRLGGKTEKKNSTTTKRNLITPSPVLLCSRNGLPSQPGRQSANQNAGYRQMTLVNTCRSHCSSPPVLVHRLPPFYRSLSRAFHAHAPRLPTAALSRRRNLAAVRRGGNFAVDAWWRCTR